jgi:hypothetical protein
VVPISVTVVAVMVELVVAVAVQPTLFQALAQD